MHQSFLVHTALGSRYPTDLALDDVIESDDELNELGPGADSPSSPPSWFLIFFLSLYFE